MNYNKCNCVVCGNELEGVNMVGWFYKNGNVINLYEYEPQLKNPLKFKKVTLYCNKCAYAIEDYMYRKYGVLFGDWHLTWLEDERMINKYIEESYDKDVTDDLIKLRNYFQKEETV